MKNLPIWGTKPYQYSYWNIEGLTETVVKIDYALYTGDSFDVGSAYSLHLCMEDALCFRPLGYAWRKQGEPTNVFVLPSTLEAIEEQKDKAIFMSWEI